MDCDVDLVNKKFSNILPLVYIELLIICCLATLLLISSRVISLPIKRFRDILVAYVYLTGGQLSTISWGYRK